MNRSRQVLYSFLLTVPVTVLAQFLTLLVVRAGDATTAQVLLSVRSFVTLALLVGCGVWLGTRAGADAGPHALLGLAGFGGGVLGSVVGSLLGVVVFIDGLVVLALPLLVAVVGSAVVHAGVVAMAVIVGAAVTRERNTRAAGPSTAP